MLEIMKILEEDDEGSCYDIASLYKMASMIGLTDKRPNKLPAICTLRFKQEMQATYLILVRHPLSIQKYQVLLYPHQGH